MTAAMDSGPAHTSIEALLSPHVAGKSSVEPSILENEVTMLFGELRLPLLRYLSSFGLSTSDAEEVIQDVFLSLFLHLRDGKPRTNLRAWIFRVAHNLSLKRRQGNQRNLQAAATAEQYVQQPLASGDPEKEMSSSQQQQRLLAIVSALPERDRRCLYLRAEGLRYREIGKVLGMSLGAVALSLARSLGRLAGWDGR